jgi:hypothetical protein
MVFVLYSTRYIINRNTEFCCLNNGVFYMMKKSLALACLTVSMGANAAIYDLDADTNERAGGDNPTPGGQEIWYDVGDFQLSAYNYALPNSIVQIWAYLDDTGGKDGGGACQTDNCFGSSDDNVSGVGPDEMLGLKITTGDFIEGFTLWGDHQNYVPSTVLVDTDGDANGLNFVSYAVSFNTVGGAFVELAGVASNNLFITTIDDQKSSELYLSAVYTGADLPAEVPVPAAAWLFGSALLGLGLVKRSKA